MTAPLKALATLAIRMWSRERGLRRVSTSATPERRTVVFEPRRSVTIAPGGPPSAATSASSWRWSLASPPLFSAWAAGATARIAAAARQATTGFLAGRIGAGSLDAGHACVKRQAERSG